MKYKYTIFCTTRGLDYPVPVFKDSQGYWLGGSERKQQYLFFTRKADALKELRKVKRDTKDIWGGGEDFEVSRFKVIPSP